MLALSGQAKHTVPTCPTKPWRSREGRLDNRPALQLQRRPILGAPLRGAVGSPIHPVSVRLIPSERTFSDCDARNDGEECPCGLRPGTEPGTCRAPHSPDNNNP